MGTFRDMRAWCPHLNLRRQRVIALAIFLHFLNREPYRAVNAEYHLLTAERSLRVLAIASGEQLFTNLSNVLEGALLAKNSSDLGRRLIEYEHLVVQGERASLEEFIDSRRERYAFDSARYPMYFDTLPSYGVRVAHVRKTSITDYLAGELEKLQSAECNPRDFGLASKDSALVLASVSDVVRVVRSRDESGITRSLFLGKIGGLQSESATARLLSAMYIKKYMTDLRCNIATGVLGLGAFDSLGDGSWHRDIRVLRYLLDALDLTSIHLAHDKDVDNHIALSRGSVWQAAFCASVRAFCETSRGLEHNGLISAVHTIRGLITAVGACKVRFDPLPGMFERAHSAMELVTSTLRRTRPDFAAAHEKYIVDCQKMRTVLLVTATAAESRALLAIASQTLNGTPAAIHKQSYLASDIGTLGDLRFLHVQCEPGSVGASNSQAVISDALRDFGPICVVMGGIAFGANRDKQRLGDVLISKFIVEYEKSKVKEAGSIPRGQKIECSPRLLSLFRAAEARGISKRMHFGAILSGEKLVDSEAFLRQLLVIEPEAVGGEMEGAGLVGAATRSQTDWIVVKAIVDWGMGKDLNNQPDHQEQVAREAFSLIFRTFSELGF